MPDADVPFPAAPAARPAAARARWLPTVDLLFRVRRRNGAADDHQILLVLRWS